MSLDEMVQMFNDAGFIDDHFGQREMGPLFNLSMMTNIKELDTERHLNMSFLEFLEALGRCADKFDLQFLEDKFPDYRAKNPYKLDKKLECICLKLMEKTLPNKVYEANYKVYKDLVETELTNPKGMKFAKR